MGEQLDRDNAIAAILADRVLKPGHKLTLIALVGGKELTIYELMSRVGMELHDRGTMQRYLKILEDRGYVVRWRNPDDRRDTAFYYALTPDWSA